VRVALACPYAWDDPGGVQVHVRELGIHLLERGHEVVALSPVRGTAMEPWVLAVGRPVDVRYNASVAPIDPRPWSVHRVRAALRSFRPDVVHAHEPLAPSTGMWATLAADVPVVGTFHAGPDRSLLYDLAAPVLQRVARRLAIRVAVSRRAEEVARSRIGGAYEVVPNGLQTEPFRTAAPADLGVGRKLLFVGRLHPRKGFPTAVAAFDLVASERPDVRLVVAGDGEQRDAVSLLRPEQRERVTMLGTVAHEQLPAIHAACDLYLGSSAGGESFGYVLLEAMAAGLPVVASDIPGYREVVDDGVEGFLVPPGDPDRLAEAALRVLGDPELAARLGDAGRRRAAQFDWEVVATHLESIYGRAAGTSQDPPEPPLR
jgi:phosphatidyl-myo-inositol alpha-mannosyltransferase